MKQLFRKLGMNEKEIETFLRLLELGAKPISVIAKYVGTPRSTMYVIIEKLKSMNLVEEVARRGVLYVKCIPVKNIIPVLQERELGLRNTISLIKDKLPELEALENKLSITPTVKFFEGKKAVMEMYEEVLREKEFRAFFNPKLVKRVMPEYHFKIPQKLKGSGGKAKELLVDGPDAKEYQKKFSSLRHEIRILPKELVFSADMIMTKSAIYMISYGEKEISATAVHNPSLAEAQRIVFDLIWKSTNHK